MTKGKVLVTEDEFVVAENLRADLESMGYEVVAMASSGQETLDLARQEKPDLVLMDIKLTGEMDGIETAIHLRRKWDIPVLFLTAHADERILERAKLAEPLGYLVKPYDRKGLQANIEMAHYRARMERLLKESEARFRSLFHNSPVAYLELDVSNRCLDLNDELCELLGYDRKELVGKNFIDLWPLETQHHLIEQFAKLRDNGRVKTELQLVHKNNTQLTVLLDARLQPCMDGDFFRIHCALHNITERKRAEKEKAALEAQNRQLQKAESLGRMAGAIAHHFNNMIGAAIGNLELAIRNLPPESGVLNNLSQATKASRRAAEVSSLMLTYLGQTPGKHELLDLSETSRLGLSLICAIVPNKVVVESVLPSPGPTIRANTNNMHQVLTNLLTNAWESICGNGEGTIRLTINTVSRADIPASHRFPIDWQPQRVPYACLEVSDTGCGISNKDIEKIFDPFFTTKFTGRGLGLPVVMGIVKAHGGGVTVESKPGQGSIFRVFFPVSVEEIRHHPDKMVELPEIERGGTILLVEDEEVVREMAVAMLTHLGFKVLEAKDGVEAMEVFLQHQDVIRCILSDLTMPRMDGWEALAALRKLSPDIPVILSSGYDEAHVMAGEHTEQPNAFLGKPYQLKGLRETINRVLADL